MAGEQLTKEIRAIRRACDRRRALVVGDVMLDVFLVGEATRLSPEAPVPVILNPMRMELLGGAAHVAAQLSHLGMRVRLYGVMGSDGAGASCSDLYLACGIGYVPLPRRGSFYPTIVKTRICAGSHQYVRLDEEPSGLSATIDGYASTRILEQEKDCHVIVVVDYGKGTCAPLDKWIRAQKGNVWQVYHSKKPERCAHQQTVLCVNEHEYARLDAKNLPKYRIVTMGGRGITVAWGEETTRIPTRYRTLCDPVGAGDVVMATAAAVLSVSNDVVLAAKIANRAAGVSVEKPYTSVVSWDEIIRDSAEKGWGA